MKSKPDTSSSAPAVVSFFSVIAVGVTAVVIALLTLVYPESLQHFVSTFASVENKPNVVNCTAAEQYLTDVLPVKGFHILCVQKRIDNKLDITAFKDGNAPSLQNQTSFEHLQTHLEVLLDIQMPDDEVARKYKQPYALFTPEGKRLKRLDDVVNNVVFLFEGGQFIWPGIRIGHKTLVKDVTGKGDVVVETLSMIPLVFSVEEFLKDDEIDIIMNLSLDHLKPSTVALLDGHENRAATDWRTSTTYFLSSNKHPRLGEIDQRVADLTKVPIEHQEDVQVLRYEKTQKYDHHTDYFPAELHKNSPDVLKSIDYGYRNRMITVFWYMSDVAKGGQTIFPRFGGAPRPQTMKDCTKGLKVPPKKRNVIVFYSLLPNGDADPMSLHGEVVSKTTTKGCNGVSKGIYHINQLARSSLHRYSRSCYKISQFSLPMFLFFSTKN
ncbi:proly 4-hydroxylase [Plasmopara halstedii]|uniref:Proly 4-hydroxylase n=1 Tax=Plasmopara halstedii TaxID=4781 RepID=A0A0P1AYE4_PLAHL|nr:proly 4-hydroxylase [Plasmopara halstedii]CEG45839.1 proly 4-hydroxylase [Plasmopara halstedii]|eukprot:XP_024582208.1 proly 4-hydroxylase [Plasmopara halstedii]